MRVDEIITVLQAFKQGKKIQVKSGAQLIWEDDESPIWDFWRCDYRVRPEPREWYIFVDQERSDVKTAIPVTDINRGQINGVHVREVIT